MNWEAISAIGQILGILITFMVYCNVTIYEKIQYLFFFYV